MDIITGIFDFGFARGMFFSIPETVRLFLTGLGLVALAGSIRSAIKSEAPFKPEEKES